MGSHDSKINDQLFEVRVIGHRLEDAPPNTFDAPSSEASENAAPISEHLGRSRQGGPLRTILRTPSTNIRLSRPVEPFWSGRPIISGAIRSYAASLKTNRSRTPKTASQKAVLNLICRLKETQDSTGIAERNVAPNAWSEQNLEARRTTACYSVVLEIEMAQSPTAVHCVSKVAELRGCCACESRKQPLEDCFARSYAGNSNGQRISAFWGFHV